MTGKTVSFCIRSLLPVCIFTRTVAVNLPIIQETAERFYTVIASTPNLSH